MLLAVAARSQVLFRSLRCVVDGVRLVVGRYMRVTADAWCGKSPRAPNNCS